MAEKGAAVDHTQALRERLPTAAMRAMFDGALHVSRDKANPIRGNAFAWAVRETIAQLLHHLAPDQQVTKCAWFVKETDNGRPTRVQRQRYIIQGGLADDYVKDVLGLDLEELHKELQDAFEALNKATHIGEGTIIAEDKAVSEVVEKARSTLAGLFDAIDSCREELLRAVADAASDEATQKILSETIQEIDEKAGHYQIERTWIDEVETTRIDSEHVWYKVTGSIEAQLQYGSGSDFRKGDGATIDHSFPFTCELPAPVSDPKKFDTDFVTLNVEDGGWYD
jgi:aminopeptidase N